MRSCRAFIYVCVARGLSRSWDSLRSTRWRARMRSEIMKDGAAGQCLRSTSPVPAEWSVFYKAIRWTRWRRSGPLPVGVRSIYRATWPSAWAREWETRLYADTYSLAPYSTPFRDRHPLLSTFLRIVTLEDLTTVPRGTCYAEKRSPFR